jgi:sugar lactone lactonase YvrE
MSEANEGWRCLWQAKAHLGESALWDERDGCIYWVDIEAPSVNWYHLQTGATDSWVPPRWISALALRQKGGFVASCADGFAYVEPRAGTYQPFCEPRRNPTLARLNDGVTDRKGRYWSGSCDNAQWNDSTTAEDKEASVRDFDVRNNGELYRLDPSGEVTCMQRDIVTSNGPAFSPDGKTMYFNDSLPRVTWAYDLADDGSLSHKRDFLLFDESHGFPDGMTVDAEGGIWIAFFESWVLRRYSAAAALLEERKLPVKQGLRPAFGGPGLSRLFLISGAVGFTAQLHAEQPLAGSLFEILEPGVCGLPDVPFAG